MLESTGIWIGKHGGTIRKPVGCGAGCLRARCMAHWHASHTLACEVKEVMLKMKKDISVAVPFFLARALAYMGFLR